MKWDTMYPTLVMHDEKKHLQLLAHNCTTLQILNIYETNKQ